MTVLELAWLIPVFPLAGAIVNGLVGKRLGRTAVGAIAVLAMVAAFGLSVAVSVSLGALHGRPFSFDLFPWIPLGAPAGKPVVGEFTAPAGILVDPLSVVMILVVTGVGLLIHIYSLGYMGHDPDYSRYFAYLNLFAASMLTLVLANNLLLMFVGWEGVGLCSYLLIGFWYERESASAAGKKAFIINRVGDFGFVLGILLVFSVFGTLRFTDINNNALLLKQNGMLTGGMATAITLLLFLGATGKSAQLPLWVWLPDAMEGPTPVSALIHAATMVTAGVYMIARLNGLYALAPTSSAVVALVGAVTAFFAATIAVTQYDLKRVLAYSTISQLGLMFLGVGVGAYTAGIFHLVTHAFFKGLLFLAAGSIMHALGNRIDLREMGQLRRYMPATWLTFAAGWLAISGLPPFAGFWSKDEILAEASAFHAVPWMPGLVLYAIGVGASLLTAFYMSRAYYLAFYSDKRIDPEVEQHIHESPPVMTSTLWILAALSVFGGLVLGVGVMAGHRSLIDTWLDPVWAPAQAVVGQQVHPYPIPANGMIAIALMIAATGLVVGWYGYCRRPFETPEPAQRGLGPLWGFFENKWYIEKGYYALFVKGGTALAEWLAGGVDQKVVDGSVNGVAGIVGGVGDGLRRWQSGYVRSYALSILLGVVGVVAYFVLR